MRRKYNRRRRRYIPPKQARRQRIQRISWTIGILLGLFILAWIIPFTRIKMAQLPPFKAIGQWWTKLIDPQKDILEQTLTTPAPGDVLSSTADANSTVLPTASAEIEEVTNPLVSLSPQYTFEIKPTIQDDAISFDVAQQLEITNSGKGDLRDLLFFIPKSETFTLTQLTVNGTDALMLSTKEGEDQLRITLAEPIASGEMARIAMAFSIRAVEGVNFPNYNNGRVAFVADFYPTLAVRYDTQWIADKVLTVQNSSNFTAIIYAAEANNVVYLGTGVRQQDVTNASSTTASTSENEAQPTITYIAKDVPNFAFSRTSRMQTGGASLGNTKLEFYFFNASNVDTWEQVSTPLLSHLVSLFGEHATPIPIIQGGLDGSCVENGGLIFVDEQWASSATDKAQRSLLTEGAKIYLAPTASADFWLYDVLSRYAGQSYNVNYQEIILQQETAPLSENSGTIENTEIDGSSIVDSEPDTAAYIPEGIDTDVYSLMGLRDVVGGNVFDSALQKYVADGGKTAFADCFSPSLKADIERWIEYEKS